MKFNVTVQASIGFEPSSDLLIDQACDAAQAEVDERAPDLDGVVVEFDEPSLQMDGTISWVVPVEADDEESAGERALEIAEETRSKLDGLVVTLEDLDVFSVEKAEDEEAEEG